MRGERRLEDPQECLGCGVQVRVGRKNPTGGQPRAPRGWVSMLCFNLGESHNKPASGEHPAQINVHYASGKWNEMTGSSVF